MGAEAAILGHELGHQVLEHLDEAAPPGDLLWSRQQELDADMAGWAFMFASALEDGDSDAFLWRFACADFSLRTIKLLDDCRPVSLFENSTHPSPALRLASLDDMARSIAGDDSSYQTLMALPNTIQKACDEVVAIFGHGR